MDGAEDDDGGVEAAMHVQLGGQPATSSTLDDDIGAGCLRVAWHPLIPTDGAQDNEGRMTQRRWREARPCCEGNEKHKLVPAPRSAPAVVHSARGGYPTTQAPVTVVNSAA
jgi:hypothetical protein